MKFKSDTPLAERLSLRSVRNVKTGCIEWVAYLDRYGYGTLNYRGKVIRAHRASYEVTHGPILEGLVIDHLCDNRKCINPEHLKAVSNKDNVTRAAHINMQLYRDNRCIRGHEKTGENLYISPSGRRECRLCVTHRSLNYYYRKVRARRSA
jgi:hypothetical protein